MTGADGFIGKHTCNALKKHLYDVIPFDTNNSEEELITSLKEANFIIHLAGVNRPLSNKEFYDGYLVC